MNRTGKDNYLNRWTLEADKEMLDMIADGKTCAEIAKHFNRSRDAVSCRLTWLRRQGVNIPKRSKCNHLAELRTYAQQLKEPKAGTIETWGLKAA